MTEYSPAKTGEYPRTFPNIQNCACCEKDLKDLRSRKTVRFSEQIMSEDKYPSIFSRQMEAIVYLKAVQKRLVFERTVKERRKSFPAKV